MTRGNDVAGGVTGVGSYSGARRLRRVLKGVSKAALSNGNAGERLGEFVKRE